MRAICCEQCGKFKPTPAEDAASGLFTRYTRGNTRGSYYCDYCGTTLTKGSLAVAISIPHTIGQWEENYIESRAEGKGAQS